MPINLSARTVPSAAMPTSHNAHAQLPAFDPLNNTRTESGIDPLPQPTLFSPLPSNNSSSETLFEASPAIRSFSHAARVPSSADPECLTGQSLSFQDHSIAHSTAPSTLSSFDNAQQLSDNAHSELQRASVDQTPQAASPLSQAHHRVSTDPPACQNTNPPITSISSSCSSFWQGLSSQQLVTPTTNHHKTPNAPSLKGAA